jgi:hypothetical protein
VINYEKKRRRYVMSDEELKKATEKGTERESAKKFNLPLFVGIVILVALVIIAVLTLFVGVPEPAGYQEIVEENQPQAALMALRTNYMTKMQTEGLPEDYSVEEAIRDAAIEDYVLRDWTFIVEGMPPMRYIAVSTSEFAEGEGNQVIYNEETGEFVCIRKQEGLED